MAQTAVDSSTPSRESKRRSRAVMSAERIQTVLASHGGNVSAAARDLGIGRTTLWRRMKNAAKQ
jgi:transcriptional regulator of acetoin/glycerol metabolism